ncbi:Protein NDR1 [Morella rubra]|uniref:Protein NDR1 n=1 Tax=Morella rubra TaxID=262757 RepID=A0A6A1UMC6_9ROSI|nr:Protein NDR1 [Morella rubra]
MYTPDRLPSRSTPGAHARTTPPHPASSVPTGPREPQQPCLQVNMCRFLGVFIAWLVFLTFYCGSVYVPHAHPPEIYVHEFFVPGLDQATALKNVEISFNVTVRNPNQNIGIFYDSMNGSVYYNDQQIGTKPLLFPFYQEPKNTTVVADVITVSSQRGTELMGDLAAGKVVFRLQITSTIRFKISTWDSKHHQAHASCDISVGRDGTILPISKDKRCPVYFT